MARSDWSIERILVRSTNFADLPDLVESMRIRHILKHKTIENLTKTFEQNYPTPSNEDLEKRENNWIETLEKAYRISSVSLGQIDTEVPAIERAATKSSNFARALRIVEMVNQEQNQLENSAYLLKSALPDESKIIDDLLASAKIESIMRLEQARTELKK